MQRQQYGDSSDIINQEKVCAVNQNDYLNSKTCICIEHDPDYKCGRHNLRKDGSDSKCDDHDDLLQGPFVPFTEDNPFYNSDKIVECRERCLRGYDSKAFFVHKTTNECSCTEGYCKLTDDSNYRAYDITAPFAEQPCETYQGFLMVSEQGVYTEAVEDRSLNPLTCNIESYLDYGTIMDTGECECPLYDYEKMYQDTTNYVERGPGQYIDTWFEKNIEYSQIVENSANNVNDCKTACSELKDCRYVEFGNTQCRLINSSGITWDQEIGNTKRFPIDNVITYFPLNFTTHLIIIHHSQL